MFAAEDKVMIHSFPRYVQRALKLKLNPFMETDCGRLCQEFDRVVEVASSYDIFRVLIKCWKGANCNGRFVKHIYHRLGIYDDLDITFPFV